MPFQYQRPTSLAAYLALRLGRFCAVLVLFAVTLHRFELLSTPHAVAVALLAASLAIVAMGLALIGFVMLWSIGARGGRAAFWGLITALMVLAPTGLAAQRYVMLPDIDDVSTDIVDRPEWLEPPVIEASWLTRKPIPRSSQIVAQLSAYPEATGRRYEGAIDRVLGAVQTVAQSRSLRFVASRGAEYLVDEPEDGEGRDGGADKSQRDLEDPLVTAPGSTSGAEISQAPVPQPKPNQPKPNQANPQQRLSGEAMSTAGRAIATGMTGEIVPPLVILQARYTSPVLGIEHDVLIRLVEEQDTTFVDIRAATRTGAHDLGANAALIRNFLHDLDVSLLGIAGG